MTHNGGMQRAAGRRGTAAGLRRFAEFPLWLAVGVLVVRTWLVEGFTVPSGSMAETLRGRHHHISCPECGHEFAVGVLNDVRIASAVCPNCDWPGIEVPQTIVPGDRVFVSRSAFLFRTPRRWEPVVFRHPQRPGRLAVKRVVGLPGERVAIRDGDVFINGRRVGKPLAVARAMALLVHDTRSAAPDVPPRWRPLSAESAWQRRGRGYVLGEAAVAQPSWAGAAGAGVAATHTETPPPVSDWLGYHHERRVAGRPKAVYAATITDRMAYNHGLPRREEETYVVRDLGLVVRFRIREAGRLLLRCSGGAGAVEAVLDGAGRTVALWHDGRRVQFAPQVPALGDGDWHVLEFYNFDRQPTLAIDGVALFASCELSENDSAAANSRGADPAPADRDGSRRDNSSGPPHFVTYRGNARQAEEIERADAVANASPSARLATVAETPCAIAAQCAPAASVELDWIRLVRDVYYTPGPLPLAGSQPRTEAMLDRDTYFVLGDNSPISADSRSWPGHGIVQRSAIVGRPLCIYLPVRVGHLSDWELRIPDLRRIGYIR